MKNILLALSVLVFTSTSFGAFSGTWDDMGLVPNTITDVQIKVFNMAVTHGRASCNDSQCYRVDIILNGRHVARWATSPGRPHYGTNFVGNYTPIYSGRSLHSRHIHNRYTSRRGDSMPYAMFVKLVNGGKSPIAIHAGRVTGRRESHGCVRMIYNEVQMLNAWVRESFRNGGKVRLWTRHVRP